MDLGVQRMVILEEGDLIRELFRNPALNGRAHDASVVNWIDAGWGMFFMDDDRRWRLSRKAAVRALSLFASARNSKLSAAVARAADSFKKMVTEKEGQPLDVRDDIFKVTNSVVMELIFGKDADLDDPQQQMAIKYVSGLLDDMGELMMLNPLPILAPFYRSKMAEQKKGVDKFTRFLLDLVKEHQFDGEVRTIADAIKKSAAEITDEELEASGMTRDHLLLVSVDLYTAGMFDTAENTQWFLVLMASHPKIQERLAYEVRELTGGSRPVESADQPSLIYAYACLMESLRFACTVAFIMPHTATADVQLREWNIPKGTQFVANVWKAHKDPDVFPEPYKFNPERFIKDGAIDTALANQVLVFSAGGRRCIGEAFAKQEIFVIVLNIIQDLIVELDPGFLHFKVHIEGCDERPPTDYFYTKVAGRSALAFASIGSNTSVFTPFAYFFLQTQFSTEIKYSVRRQC